MKPDVFRRTREQFRDQRLGKPNRFPIEMRLDSHFAVGLIDDDIFLRGRYIGGLRVLGTIDQAKKIINANKNDLVKIAETLIEKETLTNEEIEELLASNKKTTKKAASKKPAAKKTNKGTTKK